METLVRWLAGYVSGLVGSVVQWYFDARGLVWPTEQEALMWAVTELGEALEVLMAKKSWVRNNPDSKPSWSVTSFCRELGDVILMVLVAGYIAGGDPLHEMFTKMWEKANDKS